MVVPEPSYSGLLLGLGIFFFVGYFIPISAGRLATWPSSGRAVVVFFWDLFGSRDFAELAALATYLMLAGVALPLVGYLVPGLARLITFCSIGALGMVLVLVAESSAYPVVRDLALLALLLALIGNRIRREMPDSLLARLLAGLSAGAAVVFLLAELITGLAQGSFSSPRPGLNIIGIILNVLCILSLIASGILLLVSVSGHPKVAALSRAARLLAIIGVSVQLGWGLVSATIGACIAGGALSGIWAFLMTLRTTGFLLGVLAVLGISGYPLLKMAALALPPDVPPAAPTPV